MDATYGLIIVLLSLVSLVLVLAIIVVVLPLWASARAKILELAGRAQWSLWVVIGFCAILIVQEFQEQRRISERRQEAMKAPHPKHGPHLMVPIFRHQRNIYLFAIPAVLALILKILIRLLASFNSEMKEVEKKKKPSEE
jgi:hypothetical protein